MASESKLKENLDHAGKSMEVVGAIGAAAGLAIAALSGPIAMSAVLAEVSLDVGMVIAGLLINKYDDLFSTAITALTDFAAKKGIVKERAERSNTSRVPIVSAIALATAPLDFAVGFAITGFSAPLAYTAVIVTSLPCVVLAVAGIIQRNIKLKREAANEAKKTAIRAAKPAQKERDCASAIRPTERADPLRSSLRREVSTERTKNRV
ncbi:MAG: hypothetical protein ACYCO0_02965 [Candidatus Micrarchaeaceae archaeon]